MAKQFNRNQGKTGIHSTSINSPHMYTVRQLQKHHVLYKLI